MHVATNEKGMDHLLYTVDRDTERSLNRVRVGRGSWLVSDSRGSYA